MSEAENLGVIVAFEGLDGCGKSHLAQVVAAKLAAMKHQVWLTTFPSLDGAIGRFIREQLFTGKQQVDPQAMLWLFAADGKDREAKVLARVKDGQFIIFDRDAYISAWAYHLSHHSLEQVVLCRPADAVAPDFTFILDTPLEVISERLERRRATGKAHKLYEQPDPNHLRQLQDRYQAYAALHDNAVVLPTANRTLDELADIVLRTLGLLSEEPHGTAARP